MMPTAVISNPLAHQGLVVINAFDAPTAKCAMVLMMNEAMTAGMPTVKKNGMIGMNPPTAVEMPAENVDLIGFGKRFFRQPELFVHQRAQELLRFVLQPAGHRGGFFRR